jgi:hypothetical protein
MIAVVNRDAGGVQGGRKSGKEEKRREDNAPKEIQRAWKWAGLGWGKKGVIFVDVERWRVVGRDVVRVVWWGLRGLACFGIREGQRAYSG